MKLEISLMIFFREKAQSWTYDNLQCLFNQKTSGLDPSHWTEE